MRASIGHVPPTEAEANFYQHQTNQVMGYRDHILKAAYLGENVV
jgi:hypothetical protein